MKLNFKKTYKFAVKSALYISVFSTLFVVLLATTIFNYTPQKLMVFGVIFIFTIYLFSFIVIQYRVEHFIYRRVKKIYDDVSLLESSTFINQPITTDMETLTREVKKFATDKKLEIEMLQVREEYRREFLGNVSHELKTPLFTVQGYISTLLDGAMDDKAIRKKYLKHLHIYRKTTTYPTIALKIIICTTKRINNWTSHSSSPKLKSQIRQRLKIDFEVMLDDVRSRVSVHFFANYKFGSNILASFSHR